MQSYHIENKIGYNINITDALIVKIYGIYFHFFMIYILKPAQFGDLSFTDPSPIKYAH